MSFGLGFGFPGTVAAGSGATLALQFAGATALDPRITFTRASSATFTNSAGLVALSPINLLTYSEQFDNAAWNALSGALVVTPNTEISPDGTLTADTITLANAFKCQSVSVTSGAAYTFSVYMRTDAGTKNIQLREINGSGQTTVTVTTSWQRFTLTYTSGGVSNFVGIDQRSGTSPSQSGVLYIWGAQLQTGSTATTYIPTVATATGAARFDYDPVTLQPKGLLIEEARTNVILYSGAISVANGWATDAVSTLATNQATAPDGTLTASQLQYISNKYIYQNKTVTTATAYTWSLFVKLGTGGDGTVNLDHQTGAGYFSSTFNLLTGVVVSGAGVIQSVGNGWYRCSLTYTTTSTNDLIDFVMNGTFTAGQGHYIWGAQLEAGAFATSYIPTVAAQATRAAENAVMTGTNFSSWYNQTEGTMFEEADVIYTGNFLTHSIYFSASNSATDSLFFQGVQTSTQITPSMQVLGVEQLNYVFINRTSGFDKLAIAYQLNNTQFAGNTDARITDTVCTIPTVDKIHFGTNKNAAQWLNGHIKRITYWPRRLSNAELQAVTR